MRSRNFSLSVRPSSRKFEATLVSFYQLERRKKHGPDAYRFIKNLMHFSLTARNKPGRQHGPQKTFYKPPKWETEFKPKTKPLTVNIWLHKWMMDAKLCYSMLLVIGYCIGGMICQGMYARMFSQELCKISNVLFLVR